MEADSFTKYLTATGLSAREADIRNLWHRVPKIYAPS